MHALWSAEGLGDCGQDLLEAARRVREENAAAVVAGGEGGLGVGVGVGEGVPAARLAAAAAAAVGEASLSLLCESVCALPAVEAADAPFHAEFVAPPTARLREPFVALWRVANRSGRPQVLRVSAETAGATGFAWAGKASYSVAVAPGERVELPLELVPVEVGHCLLPQLSVESEGHKAPVLQGGVRQKIFVEP